jgi:cell shape-determining protein MreD
MATLAAFPVVILLTMLQIGVVSRLPLLHGTADVVLLGLVAWSLHERVSSAWFWAVFAGLLVSMVSALPFLAPLWGYLIVTTLARLLRQRVWQTPFLAMLLVTFAGTLVTLALDWAVLQFQTGAYPLSTAINLIVMPSALLNLLFALPVYALVNDLADFLYPEKVEV